MTIQYEIAILDGPSLLRGQGIHLSLSLVNVGAEAVRLPVPNSSPNAVYALVSPGTEQALLADPVRGRRSSPAESPESEITQFVLQPGQNWSGVISLEDLFPLKENGTYRISSTLSFQGSRLASNTAEFRVDEARILQLGAAPLGAPSPNGVKFAYLRDKGDARGLMVDTWKTGNKEDSTPESLNLSEIRSLSAEAVDPVPCATTHYVGQDLFTYIFWRQGDIVLAEAGSHPIDRQLALPAPAERLLHPALLGPGRVAHAYALLKMDGAPRLAVLRFASHLKEPGNSEKLLAVRPLAGAPADAAAAIDLYQGQARRMLMLVRLEGPAPRFEWMSYRGDAVSEALRVHTWTKKIAVEQVPDSRPAILGLQEGGVRVAWLVRETGQPARGMLLEATFDASGALVKESASLLKADNLIRAARIVYHDGVPFVVAWTEDGKVRAGEGEGFRTVVEKASGKMPPTLCLLFDTPYVVESDPTKGMVLISAR